ncbi:MAG: ribonuclease R [Defluviitaleaceae bacterium]|nr:ribonuclease R [Defluviitaleaceae bacterium]
MKKTETNEEFENKKELILDALLKISKPIKISDLSYLLFITKEKKEEFNEFVNTLIKNGDVYLTKKNTITLPRNLGIYKGVFHNTVKGFGFVAVENMKKDIFIPFECVNGAMHSDTVFIKIMGDYGEVLKVTQRNIETVVGTANIRKNSILITPKNNLIPEIVIKKTSKIVDSHIVVVKITKYPTIQNKNIEAKLIEILGHENDPGVDILSIIKEANIRVSFSNEVLNEAQLVLNSPYENRTDLRNLKIVTIDGEDAKDLDDAISISFENNIYTLGVHIADVSHYVRNGTVLDEEAKNRGTSIYLIDRVIPMLPHSLSNGICSLTENEDRLALSLFMKIDKDGNVIDHNTVESIINVSKRMTYTEVFASLQNPIHGYENYIEDLKTMESLAKILRNKRFKRGSLDFSVSESKVLLNEHGKIEDIVLREKNTATNIIEEFMLIANETIAQEYFWLSAPFIYRNHTKPDKEKLEELNVFISNFGYKLKGNKDHPKNIQLLLQNIKDTKEEMIINHVILRSLKHANYSSDNTSHFGLSTKYYCHFTSPIRRYPDLFIHRVIKAHINGENLNKFSKNIEEIASLSSFLEKRAEELERNVLSYKKAQYMSDKLGMIFNGIISSVTSWGIYVSLPNTIEGMVRISDIKNDNYIYQKEKYRYVGEFGGKIYAIGDSVEVQLIAVNEGKIDFIFI